VFVGYLLCMDIVGCLGLRSNFLGEVFDVLVWMFFRDGPKLNINCEN